MHIFLRLFVSIIFFFTLCNFSCVHSTHYKLSVCAIFQNEARFMKEWIDYHRLAGVEHFYLYNNDSTDNYLDVLGPYIQQGVVEYFYWPDITPEIWFPFGCQAKAYQDALERSKDKTEWLAVLDLDEFVVPRNGLKITHILNKYYKHEAGIYIYWQKFGTSHVQEVKPGELMIEKLTWKAEKDAPCNQWYKTICRPKYTVLINNPHCCNYVEGKAAVDATSRFQINHYWTRDESHLITVKCARYQNWNWKIEQTLEAANQLNQVQDLLIQKYVPYFKKIKNQPFLSL